MLWTPTMVKSFGIQIMIGWFHAYLAAYLTLITTCICISQTQVSIPCVFPWNTTKLLCSSVFLMYSHIWLMVLLKTLNGLLCFLIQMIQDDSGVIEYTFLDEMEKCYWQKQAHVASCFLGNIAIIMTKTLGEPLLFPLVLCYFHKMCSLNRWTIRSLTSWLLIGFHWSFALTMTYPKVWMVFLLFHQLTWKEQACSLKVKWQNNRLRINLGNCLDGDNNVLWNMAFMLCYLSRPNGNT